MSIIEPTEIWLNSIIIFVEKYLLPNVWCSNEDIGRAECATIGPLA